MIDCGDAVYEMANGVKFFADCIDYEPDTHQIIARGNVVFTNPEGRIAAETIEFNIQTGLGTFHEANGLMSLGPKADRKQFGNQEPDVYFWGKTIEKLGPRKYHITEGGFTTCVQPTPRWDLRTGNVTLNLNDYAFARNTVLQVKGVPIFYFPFVYYPIQDSDRATGFLLPTYGTSTLRGQAFSNAFFWAIDRSQDLTFFHDWFTKTGQGFGAEYRYVANAQSYGNVRYYLLDQHSSQYTLDNVVTTLPATKSFELAGNATHILTPRWRARGRVDYVSDILTQQIYHQNVARASNPMRTIDGNLSGAWNLVNVNASVQWTEVFSSQRQSQQYGGTPRIMTTVAPRQLFGMPIYAGVNSDYAYQPYRTHQQRCRHGRQEPAPIRHQPDGPVPTLEIDVPYREFQRDVPKHLLQSQLRRDRRHRGRTARPSVHPAALAGDRAGADEDLGHAGELADAADEARHRADVHGRLLHRHRQLPGHPLQLRPVGPRHWRSGAADVRHQQPAVLSQPPHRGAGGTKHDARVPDGRCAADLLHEAARRHDRHAVHDGGVDAGVVVAGGADGPLHVRPRWWMPIHASSTTPRVTGCSCSRWAAA